MRDPVREPNEQDGSLSSESFPVDMTAADAPKVFQEADRERGPPVLGVLLVFILVFWGAVAAFFILR